MFYYKCGLLLLSLTFIISICSQVVQETNALDTGLAFFYLASAAIAGKILYDRYQLTNIIGSLTPNPNVTSFANKIASFSAAFLSLGFLVYFFLFLFKVDNYYLTALNIFICGFATLYVWMQCIITTYTSTLYYDTKVLGVRQCLANMSFLTLVVMAIFGTVTSFLPRGGANGIYFCLVVTSLCGYLLAALFCIFILTFEKEHEYFSEGLQPNLLLDDTCSLNNSSCTDKNSISGTHDTSSTMLIKAKVSCAKLS